MPTQRVIHADCRDAMRALESDSIDAIVTDPPYGLAFMGKGWDDFARQREYQARGDEGYGDKGVLLGYGRGGTSEQREKFRRRSNISFYEFSLAWAKEALRIAKPGAHIVAFGGTRTFHRLACAIEDAGWEIRDCLSWLCGSGFPKSKNLDGAWQGWGTALKPAWEPIILARKPLVGTVASNVLAHGTGAINVDGCRNPIDGDDNIHAKNPHTVGTIGARGVYGSGTPTMYEVPAGRWPANVTLDEEAAAMLDAQTGERRSGVAVTRNGGGGKFFSGLKGTPDMAGHGPRPDSGYGDSGGASRFFYTAKASRSERGEGNTHPTVKPVSLMRWLCRLVCPPGGSILDPFAGSGTTLLAAREEGFSAIGVEREAEYVEIIRNRLADAQPRRTPRRLVEAPSQASSVRTPRRLSSAQLTLPIV